jgi:Lrp/AsnC family transcriptional regulator, leucine-responsive regulatory protein
LAAISAASVVIIVADSDKMCEKRHMHLDSFDRHILNLVQEDCTLSHAALGGQVGLSASAVRRRLQAMRQAGVIEREVAHLGPAARPGGITVIVAVTFERETRAAYDQFRAAMRADPCVQQCYATAGQSDFMLVVTAASPHAYEAWGEATLMTVPGLKRYESYVVWSTVKFTTKQTLE